MRALPAVVLIATGCTLYNHGDDDCVLDVPATDQNIRDPYTGQCHFYPSGECPDPLVHTHTGGRAVCGGPCEALSESACFDATGCHAAYEADSRGNGVSFLGCWAVTIGGTQDRGDCAQLDVLSCPYREDCATWYAASSNDARAFDHCASELGRESCEPGTCGAPPPCPSSSIATTRNGCYTGHCIPASQCPKVACTDLTSEAQCAQRAECEPLYRGDGCTCTPTACICDQRTFEQCHDAPH